jgi:hypothetical protein
MKKRAQEWMKTSLAGVSAAALALVVGLAPPSEARADEAYAKSQLKAMSDYLAAQTALSFEYDAYLEVVTTEQQKLGLASSGAGTLVRPDKIRATRTGGFSDVEMLFDGTTVTLFGKTANIYAQINVPGTVDHLIDELRDKYGMPFPAADLLMSNVYDELMADVTDTKDLGSGVVDGVECDHFAFRTKVVDWQIWIAPGDRPYPCLYVITTKDVAGEPQYSVRTRNWKTEADVVSGDFVFKNSTNAEKIDPKDLPRIGDLPKHFVKGGAQ